MDKLRCVVERITYENEQTGYTVIKMRAKGYSDLIAVVGNLSAVTVGSVLTVQGEWRVDYSDYSVCAPRNARIVCFLKTLEAK